MWGLRGPPARAPLRSRRASDGSGVGKRGKPGPGRALPWCGRAGTRRGEMQRQVPAAGEGGSAAAADSGWPY